MSRLNESQYWKWRNHISEMWNAENKETAAKAELVCMNLKAQVASLQAQLYAAKYLSDKTKEKEAAQKAYADHKKQLEETLGVSLSGVTIDDTTFEIMGLE